MPFGFFGAAIQLIGSFISSLVQSRIGQIAIAFVVGWVWAYWDTNDAWKTKIAAEKLEIERQYQAEIRRQQAAASDIAAAATVRAEDDQKAIDDLQKQIDEFNAKEPTYVPAPASKPAACPPARCAIDDSFAGVVRKLDQTGHRKSRTSRRTR